MQNISSKSTVSTKRKYSYDKTERSQNFRNDHTCCCQNKKQATALIPQEPLLAFCFTFGSRTQTPFSHDLDFLRLPPFSDIPDIPGWTSAADAALTLPVADTVWTIRPDKISIPNISPSAVSLYFPMWAMHTV